MVFPSPTFHGDVPNPAQGVIGCTALAASGGTSLWHAALRNVRFDLVLVDEASQLLLPTALGALLCLGQQRMDEAARFVLVGDAEQLPPLVKSSQARCDSTVHFSVAALSCYFHLFLTVDIFEIVLCLDLRSLMLFDSSIPLLDARDWIVACSPICWILSLRLLTFYRDHRIPACVS